MATIPGFSPGSQDGELGEFETLPLTFTGFSPASQDGQLGAFELLPATFPAFGPGSVDGPLGIFSDLSVVNQTPQGPACVAVTTPITFDIQHLLPGLVDLTNTQVYANGELVYDGGAGGFQAPWAGSVTDNSTAFLTIQSFVCSRTPDLAEGISVLVEVFTQSTAPVTTIIDNWVYNTCPPVPLCTIVYLYVQRARDMGANRWTYYVDLSPDPAPAIGSPPIVGPIDGSSLEILDIIIQASSIDPGCTILFVQRAWDTVNLGWVYWVTSNALDAAPLPGATSPNNSGFLDPATYTIVEMFDSP